MGLVAAVLVGAQLLAVVAKVPLAVQRVAWVVAMVSSVDLVA